MARKSHSTLLRWARRGSAKPVRTSNLWPCCKRRPFGGAFASGRFFFWDLHAYACVRSTNELVKEALRQGAPEGYCATALEQEGGYGRQGRVWTSPLGGVYTSFALRPNVPPQMLPTLSLVASLAVADALEQVRPSCNPLIKWPNDVLCPQGKLAGISLEALAGGVCVGVGVNVYEPFAKREVEGKYSLAYLQDGVVEAGLSAEQRSIMTQLVESMLGAMESRYGRWLQEGFSALSMSTVSASLTAISGHPLRLSMEMKPSRE